MKMKKLAIASAVALLGMGAAYAQQTPTTTTSTGNETGLMTALTNSLTSVFNAGRAADIIAAVPATETTYAAYNGATDLGKVKYVYVPGTDSYVQATTLQIEAGTGLFVVDKAATIATPQITSFNPLKQVDITALAGAVNLSAINGSIDISGTNVNITGIAGNVGATASAATSSTALAINGNNFSTTVIGAMNSSTLDIMGKITDKTNASTTGMGIAGLSSQGGTIATATPSVTNAVAGIGNSIASIGVLSGASLQGNTVTGLVGSNLQLDLTGLTSSTTSDVTDKVTELQSMNVFNMALNMAPIVAGVKIAAQVDPNAWFLNPQTGVVNLSNMQVATTAIGAMNSSITHLGANLTTLAK